MKTIYVDIDETICFYNQECDLNNKRNYEKAIPNLENIKKINNLYDQGNVIIYWTARGSRTGLNWEELTKRQLDSWNVKYNKIKCDKPYYDLFIDDKTIRIEEL
jgi:hypothetical protein